MIQNAWTQLQFALRKKWFGKIPMRTGLPEPKLTQSVLREHQFYRYVLSQGVPPEVRNTLTQVIDIGCRNWSYSRAIAEYFSKASIHGIEVDGSRRYWNLYRRMDFAQAYADELCKEGRDVRFWHGDFENFTELKPSQSSLFCFFYPFVSENPCLKWGLPVHFVKFTALLQHAIQLSLQRKNQSSLLSLHQGEWEAEISRRIFQDMGLKFEEKILKVEDFMEFWPSQHNAYLFYSSLASI